MAAELELDVTFHGHSTVSFRTAGGCRAIIDPWLATNPVCPESARELDGLDLMLITHGHFDHVADAVPLARRFQPRIVAIHEICAWLEQQGIENTLGMNKGGTQEVDGLKVTMVHALHSSSLEDGGQLRYMGEAAGFVVELENGKRVYHAGDTAVFGDMQLIGELYAPDLAFLPIGSHYVMSPREAAHAIRLLGVRRVVPLHYGTFPVLTGTPAELAELTRDIADLEILTLKPGETRSF